MKGAVREGGGERCEAANELLREIASVGRRFFRHGERVSRLEIDARGRLWFIDKYTERRIYTHYHGRWKGFSEGGTLRHLVVQLQRFVLRGEPVPARAFGPWRPDVCDGDLWGYGEDMEAVRTAALRLGIVDATPPTAKPEPKITRKARTPDTGSEK